MVPTLLLQRGAVILAVAAAVPAGAGCDLLSTVDRNRIADGNGSRTACTLDEECPAPEDPCEVPRCERGACGVAAAPEGAAAAVDAQAEGDCQVLRCTAAGPIQEPDDTDVPVRAHDCAIDGCSQGVHTRAFAVERAVCDEDGGVMCDGEGHCVACLSGDDCPEGVCADGVCAPATCVDGAWNGDETDTDCGGSCPAKCEDGKHCETAGDCRSGVCTGGVVCSPACGDGVVEIGESCDDANDVDGDGCDSNCTPTGCGNGIVTAGEGCDDGNLTDGDGCDYDCTPTGCGNGIVTAGEGCDDGNLTDGDCCSSSCAIEPGCVMEIEPNDDCATAQGPVLVDPIAVLHAAMSPGTDKDVFAIKIPVAADVRLETFGGAGLGACDFPVDTALSVLDFSCATVLADDDDGGVGRCSRIDEAQVPPGLYLVHVWSPYHVPIVAYDLVITLTSYCGDSVIEAGEACDDGNRTGGDGCSAGCAVESGYACVGEPSVCTTCGDGLIVAAVGEACDDGNQADGDGCSVACAIETGYLCAGQPSACVLSCGDGMLNGADQCDDGNTAGGDGCSAMCAIETGYLCVGEPSACSPFCGDGIFNGTDQCDDGNLAGGDGCSPVCLVEPNYQCTTTSPGVCSLSETLCNDGLDNDGDGAIDLGDADCALAIDVGPCGPGEALLIYNAADVPRDIPDPGVVSSVLAGTHPGTIQKAAVRLSITHTWDSDLILTLSSPLDTGVILSNRRGSDGDDYMSTLFDSACPTPIGLGFAPFTGCFAPEQPLTALVGQVASGTWTLRMDDTFTADMGTLQSWSLALCITP